MDGAGRTGEIAMSIARRLAFVLAVALAALLLPRVSARAFDVVLNAQGEFMDAYLVNGTALPPKVVFIDPDPPNPDILGTPWPGFAETPQGTPPPDPPQGNRDPQGCAFDPRGNMFATDVGSGDPTDPNPNHRGALLVFFPGPRHRYETFCFLDKNLAQAGMPAMDETGNLYVPETGLARMWKYSPPFPSSAADCANADHLVTTPPTKALFPTPGAVTPSSIVRVPHTDHWYVASVIVPFPGGIINEYDANGVLVRNIVPSNMLKNPLGMDVGTDGTLYYAELNLNPDFSTGCGRVSMVRFVGGMPQAPEVLGRNLSFPDGVTVVDSSQLRVNFLKLPPAPEPDPRTCSGGGGSPSGAFID